MTGSRKYPVVTVDPRDFLPEGAIDEATALAWMENPRCLCGCGGMTTQQDRGRQGARKLPVGAYRFFKPGHEMRMPWALNNQKDQAPEAKQERANNISRGMLRHSVQAAPVMALAKEWMDENDATMKDLGELCGIDPSHLYAFSADRRFTSMRKATAARILVAIGIPLRRDLAIEYTKYQRRKGLSNDGMKIETHYKNARGQVDCR